MSVVPREKADTSATRLFRRSLRWWLAVHLSEEARDGVDADCYVDDCEQFANQPQRRKLLPQLDDAFFERREPGVTRR